jgi:hypothetical protein
MKTAKTAVAYRFTRDNSALVGFFSDQRPSTDAMNVLAQWECAGPGRTYDVVEDKDDYLIAKLSFPAAVTDKAAIDFNALCAAFGVQHEVVAQ